MISEYSAACGLLGGLRRNSFKEEEFDEIKQQGREYLVSYLKRYLGDDYPPQEDVSYLERAVYISFIKKAGRLIRFLPPEAAEVIKLLVSEFDIFNLKLLIRRIELNTDAGTHMFYWGFPFLAFKDTNPSRFKTIDEVNSYLKRKSHLATVFQKALGDLKFHKDIFYFDLRLDREYLSLLDYITARLDSLSAGVLENFVGVHCLVYALRMKFFQDRESDEVRLLLGGRGCLGKDVLSRILKASSLQEALSIIEKDKAFLKFKLQLSPDFEEDMASIFYREFLQRRGVNFFSFHPYLVFYLRQRYLVEKLVFFINQQMG